MARRAKTVEEMNVYEQYAHYAVLTYKIRQRRCELQGKSPTDPATGLLLDPVQEAAWQALRDEELAAAALADRVHHDALQPFRRASDRLNDEAYTSMPKSGAVTAYKKARDKVWREEHKFRNALRAAKGQAKKSYKSDSYHLDFE
jgi:hypothetical protein